MNSRIFAAVPVLPRWWILKAASRSWAGYLAAQRIQPTGGNTMKRKIVLFKNIKYDYECVASVSEDKVIDHDYYGLEHVALSGEVIVDFPEISKEDQVNNEIAIIDRQINKVMADSEAALTALKSRKQELLAIGHDNE